MAATRSFMRQKYNFGRQLEQLGQL
jgi:hypothetical protein